MRRSLRSTVPLVAGILAVASTMLLAAAGHHADAATRTEAYAPSQDACTADVDKTAAPSRIPLGSEVTVTLKVTGACPSRQQSAEVFLIIDASTSMGWDGKIDAAKRAGTVFVQHMDPALIRVGLISFYSVAVLEQPLTTDQAAVIAAIQGLTLDRGTNLVDSLDMGRRELSSAGVRPGANKVIVFLTDGRHRVTTPPISALDPVLAAVRAANIEVFTIGLGLDADAATLTRMATSRDHYTFSPTPDDLDAILERIAGQVKAQVLFSTARVTDEVPANMTYVPGSGVPVEPSVSPDGKTLVWDVVSVREPGFSLSYRLKPQEVGVWPTNVEAHLDYKDGYDKTGSRVFPIPEVEVVGAPTADGCVCRVVRQRVPVAVIEEILAHPERIYGWRMLLDPNKPAGPANPPRMCLNLRNLNLDYDPVWNPPIWRVGCP